MSFTPNLTRIRLGHHRRQQLWVSQPVQRRSCATDFSFNQRFWVPERYFSARGKFYKSIPLIYRGLLIVDGGERDRTVEGFNTLHASSVRDRPLLPPLRKMVATHPALCPKPDAAVTFLPSSPGGVQEHVAFRGPRWSPFRREMPASHPRILPWVGI